jgi:hypothetical protein
LPADCRVCRDEERRKRPQRNGIEKPLGEQYFDHGRYEETVLPVRLPVDDGIEFRARDHTAVGCRTSRALSDYSLLNAVGRTTKMTRSALSPGGSVSGPP